MSTKGTILVSGGAGYIGSHTAVELLGAGYDVVIADNLVNSKREAIDRIAAIAGRAPAFYEIDVRDTAALERIFDAHPITAAIHFAALKAVGESIAKPIEYYGNNLGSLLALASVMRARGIKQFVFSSSATVYGAPERSPIDESFPLSATNPYGQTKLMAEQILADLQVADPSWRIAALRYFNPVGAHESGLIGEDPGGIPNNLMPYVAQVAVGKLDKLRIFGGDYPTPDGTGVRDYIHVVDLARPPRGARRAARARCELHRQPRHRARLQRARRRARIRARVGAPRSVRNRRAPPRRRGRMLRQPGRSDGTPRLACGVRSGAHVRRSLALAGEKSARVRGVGTAHGGEVADTWNKRRKSLSHKDYFCPASAPGRPRSLV